MDALDTELQGLLSSYKSFFTVQENGKIKCEINGHTLPPRFDVVSAFIQGPKFQKLIRRHVAEDALTRYEPFVVQSKNFPLMLYCALTGQLMDKSVEAVKKHMQGKKFKRAKERFTNDEIDLRPEPSLESFGVRLPKDKQQQESYNEQQQQQQQASKASSKQRQPQQQHQNGTNGTAAADGDAGDDEEPAFWMPESDGESDREAGEGATDSDGDGDSGDEEEAAAAAAGGSSDYAMDEDAIVDPSDAAEAQPMDEDAAPSRAKQQPAAAAKQKQKQRTAGSKARGQKQKAETVANGTAAGKKKNISRPSAAKKAKH